MNFAQILDKIMTEKNISNYEMSRKTGISDSLIGYWRRGKSIPKADNLLAISKFLEVSVDYLLGNTPNLVPVVAQMTTEHDNSHNIILNTDSSVNNDIPKRDLELMEKINSLDFEDYAEIINAVNQKLKKKNSA